MKTIPLMRSSTGALILIEVRSNAPEVSPKARGAVRKLAGVNEQIEKIAEVGEVIGTVCSALFNKATAVMAATKPDEFSVEFGVTLGGSAGIPFLTEGSAEASFKITATWTLK